MRQVAGLGIVHTRVRWPSGDLALHRYPLRFHWFSDGLAVIAASSEYQKAVGCRVQQMGSHTPGEVEAAVAALIPNENEMGLHQESPEFLRVAELLQYLKIAEADGRIRCLLQQGEGTPFVLEIAPSTPGNPTRWIQIWEALSIPRGLAHQRLNEHYWYQYLPEAKALYLQYNACRNVPEYPFPRFVADLFAFADSHTVERLIVDLRRNGGGSSRVVRPLVSGLKARPEWTERGRLYVLIGRQTVSSGLFAALDLRSECHAVLIGEPTGAKPNAYGDMRSFRLPNSRVEVTYSTKYFRLIKDGDPEALYPDVAVTCSLEDFVSGCDPALDVALSRRADVE